MHRAYPAVEALSLLELSPGRKLHSRKVQCQFPAHDRLLRDVQFAEQALHDLLMEIETLMSYKHHSPEPNPAMLLC